MNDEPAPIGRAFLTGATGFVGRNLAAALTRRRCEVHALVRDVEAAAALPELRGVHVHAYDGHVDSVCSAVAASRAEVVFHVAAHVSAAHARRDVDRIVGANVTLGTHLLEALRETSGAALVNTGTSWQHLHNAAYDPVSLYAATKQAFEAVLEYYVRAEGLRAITLVMFDTYGPRDPRPKLLSLLRHAAATGEALHMTAGEQEADLVYIDDVIRAYLVAAARVRTLPTGVHERWAVRSGHPIRVRDLVQAYGRALGREIPVVWGAKPYRAREPMVAWSAGATLPGWAPAVPLTEGLALTEASQNP